MFKIVDKFTTSYGIALQLEDWRAEVSKNPCYRIGVYLKHDYFNFKVPSHMPFLKEGEVFRVTVGARCKYSYDCKKYADKVLNKKGCIANVRQLPINEHIGLIYHWIKGDAYDIYSNILSKPISKAVRSEALILLSSLANNRDANLLLNGVEVWRKYFDWEDNIKEEVQANG